MRCDKVIKGCMAQYEIEEITIIEGHQVHFSGSHEAFLQNCDISMVMFRDALLKREVSEKTVLNSHKLFIFLAPQAENKKENEL